MKINCLVGNGTARSQAIGDLCLRLFVGVSLGLVHGLGKLPPSEMFVQGVTSLGFPLPGVFAWMAALSEFAGGILLALGLFTRPAAFFVAFTMGVAAFGAHAADPYQKKELALAFFFVGIFYLLNGAKCYSLDAILRKKCG